MKQAVVLMPALLWLSILPPRAAATEKGTQFWNLAAKTVTHLQLAPAGSSEFGPDVAGNDPDGAVDPDERVTITGVETGRYDLKIAFKDGQICLVKDVAVEKDNIFSVDAKALADCSK